VSCQPLTRTSGEAAERLRVKIAAGGDSMERMGSLDAALLAVEDPVNHMSIRSVAYF